jgi:hypothetical protein
MNIIWKRPDGFHGASPADFVVIELGGHSNLWLHKADRDSFPFRVSGGWEEEGVTSKLNNLVNLLRSDLNEWVTYLTKAYHQSMMDDSQDFYDELEDWVSDLKKYLKGDKWEIEIMAQALDMVKAKLKDARTGFLSKAKVN